jgi:transcriptional regulator with XRE-family HTH domain
MAVRRGRLGERRAARQAEAFGVDVAMARARLKASLRTIAGRAGVSADAVRRVEIGDPAVQLDTLCAVGEAVGLDVVLKGYAGSRGALRDAGQLAIARILCALAHPSWKPQFEVPAGEHGEAVDIGFFGASEILATEIDRLVPDFQDTHRRNARKREFLAGVHQRPVRMVMVVQDTARNRRALEPHLEVIRSALPAGSREVQAALRSGEPLGRDGLLWIRPYRPPKAPPDR